MPVASGKYLVVEASTLEIRKRQRVYLENVLKSTDLTPNRRAELEASLRLAANNEFAAKEALYKMTPAEEQPVKNNKGGDEGEKGAAGSDSNKGKHFVTEDRDEAESDEDEMSGFEMLMLFFYMMGQNNFPVNPAMADPLSVAQLFLNKDQKIASIPESYGGGQNNGPHPSTEYLSALEQYAAGLGMMAMHVKVHPEVATLFKEKFGYEPHGDVVNRKGKLVQKMRKILNPTQAPTPESAAG